MCLFGTANFVLLAALFVLLPFPRVETCKCKLSSFNQTMCEAKWVSHVSVLNNETTAHSVNYTMKFVEVFKAPNGTQMAGSTRRVLTPLHDATCGVSDLQPDRDYLLAGNVDDGDVLRINLCLYVPLADGSGNPMAARDWDAVPDELKKRLAEWKGDYC